MEMPQIDFDWYEPTFDFNDMFIPRYQTWELPTADPPMKYESHFIPPAKPHVEVDVVISPPSQITHEVLPMHTDMLMVPELLIQPEVVVPVVEMNPDFIPTNQPNRPLPRSAAGSAKLTPPHKLNFSRNR